MQSIGWQQAAIEQAEEPDHEHPKVKPEAGAEKSKTYDKGCAWRSAYMHPVAWPCDGLSFIMAEAKPVFCLRHEHESFWPCARPRYRHEAGHASLTRRFISPHPGSPDEPPTDGSSYLLMHPVYSKEYLESIHPRHKTPETVRHAHFLSWSTVWLSSGLIAAFSSKKY